MNKLITKGSTDNFFALRVSLRYTVSDIDVGDITEVRIRSDRSIQGQAGWLLQKVQ